MKQQPPKPEVRSLREVVKDGKYQIDPVAVADGLMRHCAREWPVMASLMADALAEAVAESGSAPPEPSHHGEGRMTWLDPRRLCALGRRPPYFGRLATALIRH